MGKNWLVPITTTANSISVTLSSTTEAVPVTFPFWDDTDLNVIVTDQTTNLDTTLTLTTHYTVSGVSGSTGTVTLTGASSDVAIGDTLTIERSIPYTQSLDLEEGDPLPSSSLEQRLDRLTVQIQQVKAIADRALKFGVTSGAIAEGDLKDPTSRFLYVDSADTISGLTAAQVAALAAFTGDAHASQTFADTAARTAAEADYIGQLGLQLDTNDLYYSTALTAGSWTLFADNAAVAKSLFDANTVLYATSDDTPVALTMAAQSAMIRAAGNITNQAFTEGTILGRLTGGNLGAITPAAALAEISSTQGVVLYHNGTAWVALSPGTSGQFLQTQGAGANPQWAAGSSGWTFVDSQTASTSASLDFADHVSGYDYLYVLDKILPATDNQVPWLRLSDDNGSTYEADASDYNWAWDGRDTNGAINASNAGDTEIQLFQGVGNAAGEEGISGEILVINPMATAKTVVQWKLSGESPLGNFGTVMGGGTLTTAIATDGLQVLYASGNITSGVIRRYRRPHS